MNPALDPLSLRAFASKYVFFLGLAVLLIGVGGFIPGLMHDFDHLELWGPDSKSSMFGIGQLSILHNVVHLVLGGLAMFASRTWEGTRLYMTVLGPLYLAWAVFGFLVGSDSGANWAPTNALDDVGHLWIGGSLTALAVLTALRAPGRGAAPAS